MPKALPRVFRATRRAKVEAPARPAEFFVPTTVSKRFCSNDDRVELREVRRERRAALAALRRHDATSWRDAP